MFVTSVDRIIYGRAFITDKRYGGAVSRLSPHSLSLRLSALDANLHKFAFFFWPV